MRAIQIIPKDRTMTRKQWKALDSYLRRAFRKLEPDIERAYMDLVRYGSATIRVNP